MKRIVLSFATGASQYRTMAKALGLSLRLHGSQAKRVLMTDQPGDPELQATWDQLIPPTPGYSHWFLKLSALEATDADQILFIDGDSLAVGNVDPIFDQLAGSDFAVQGRWERDPGDWYGNFRAAMDRVGVDQAPKFSGGFLYYENTDRARALLQEINQLKESYDDLGLRRNGGHVVDEVCISLAMAKTQIGRVVPDSANYSLTPWRRNGRLNLDVLRGECSFFRSMPEPEIARPLLYHSARAKWDLDYWRQVRVLIRLLRNPRTPFMEQTPSARIRQKLARVAVEVYRKLCLPDDR